MYIKSLDHIGSIQSFDNHDEQFKVDTVKFRLCLKIIHV